MNFQRIKALVGMKPCLARTLVKISQIRGQGVHTVAGAP
jgi:hypothetical protein